MNANALVEETYYEDHRMRLGNKIREFREKKGYSQEKLANVMKVSRTTISKIESGKYNLSVDYLSKFSWFLGFDLNISENKTN